MKKGEVEKARGRQAQDQQYVNLVTQAFEVSRDSHLPFWRNAERWYRLYRQYKQGKIIPYRSNITVPLAFSMIQSGIARKLEFVSGGNPVSFRAGGPEDQIIARKRDLLINQQLYDANFVDKESMHIAQAEIFGISVLKYFWDYKKELISFRADMGGGEQEYAGEDVTFDGPNHKPVNIRNFFPQPDQPRLRDMRWVVHRYHLDIEDVNRLAEAGYFSKKGAADVVESPGNLRSKHDEILAMAENPAKGMAEGQLAKKMDFEKPVEILEYWGRVPRSMSIDGQVNLVVTVANRQTLLRARPNPYGKLPFIETGPMPDPFHFHRPSKIEVIEKLQIATNALASQKLDATVLSVDPQYIYNKRATSRPQRLWNRPGAVHGWDGPIDPANFQQLVPNLQGVMNAYQELEMQAQWMEQGTGIVRDAIQGFSGPDRETARGYIGRQNAANARLLMESKLHETLSVEPLAMAYVDLNRRFLDFPQQLRMIGSAALLDPLTMQPIPPEMTDLNVNDMLPDYDAQAGGVLRYVGKGEMLQNLTMLGQFAMANPIGAQMINWMYFFRQCFMLAEIPNVDEMMNTDPVVQNMMMQVQANMDAMMQQQQQMQAQMPPQPENQVPNLGAF